MAQHPAPALEPSASRAAHAVSRDHGINGASPDSVDHSLAKRAELFRRLRKPEPGEHLKLLKT